MPRVVSTDTLAASRMASMSFSRRWRASLSARKLGHAGLAHRLSAGCSRTIKRGNGHGISKG